MPVDIPNPLDPASALPFADADIPKLAAIYAASLIDFRELAQQLSDAQWVAASPCPGWSVGDVVAHVVALESELHGDPLPDHEPDWAALPHITNDFSRMTERAVDWYRTKTQDVVVAELFEITAWRRDDLAEIETDPTEIVAGPLGLELPRDRMLRTRILDVWTHEQDIRTAAQIPGGLDTDGAWVCAGQFVSGLPFIWGKRLGAAPGEVLDLTVTGPGVSFRRIVRVMDNGRAAFVDSALGQEPSVVAELSWPIYAAASAGRLGPDPDLNEAAIMGDERLATALVAALTVTP